MIFYLFEVFGLHVVKVLQSGDLQLVPDPGVELLELDRAQDLEQPGQVLRAAGLRVHRERRHGGRGGGRGGGGLAGHDDLDDLLGGQVVRGE